MISYIPQFQGLAHPVRKYAKERQSRSFWCWPHLPYAGATTGKYKNEFEIHLHKYILLTRLSIYFSHLFTFYWLLPIFLNYLTCITFILLWETAKTLLYYPIPIMSNTFNRWHFLLVLIGLSLKHIHCLCMPSRRISWTLKKGIRIWCCFLQ